jgi:hypothetical protein
MIVSVHLPKYFRSFLQTWGVLIHCHKGEIQQEFRGYTMRRAAGSDLAQNKNLAGGKNVDF